jgi:GntR family transcriptional repressor for pyruvate dehydrogenase complex
MLVIPILEMIMPKAKRLQGISLERQKLYRQVAEQIQSSVMRGDLNAGDRLPSERDLAEQLGVSRTVIRDALRLLEERGLIAINVGDGTYVSEIQPKSISESISLYVKQKQTSYAHLAQVRRMIEVEIAVLAAKNATPENIERLEQAVEDSERSIHSLQEFVPSDIRFHELLAEASQNPLLPMLLTPISEPLHDLSSRASSLPGAPEDALNHHKNILKCIKQKDWKGARLAMNAHLDSAELWGQLAAEQIQEELPLEPME